MGNLRCYEKDKSIKKKIETHLNLMRMIRTCREIISSHVIVAMINVYGAQVFPDIPYRWLRLAMSVVAFQEWVYRIHDSGVMTVLTQV